MQKVLPEDNPGQINAVSGSNQLLGKYPFNPCHSGRFRHL